MNRAPALCRERRHASVVGAASLAILALGGVPSGWAEAETEAQSTTAAPDSRADEGVSPAQGEGGALSDGASHVDSALSPHVGSGESIEEKSGTPAPSFPSPAPASSLVEGVSSSSAKDAPATSGPSQADEALDGGAPDDSADDIPATKGDPAAVSFLEHRQTAPMSLEGQENPSTISGDSIEEDATDTQDEGPDESGGDVVASRPDTLTGEAAVTYVEPPRTHPFVKGWLTGAGDIGFVPMEHQLLVGFQTFPEEVQLSDTLIRRTYYLSIVPRASFHIKKLFIGLEVPLAFEIFSAQIDETEPDVVYGEGFNRFGQFAGVLWDEPGEYAQVIRYIRLGNKEDDIYLNVSRLSAATLGHGAILRRYNPNIDLDHFRVSAQYDQSFHYGGIELYTNDVVGYEIDGALGYIKPGRFLDTDELLVRSTSFGLTVAFDRLAPYRLTRDMESGGALVADAYQRPATESTRVAAVVGVDAETKVVHLDPFLDVKAYSDYSRLLVTGGDGFSTGGLFRLNLRRHAPDARIHAFRIRTEAGLYHARYAPGYFDIFYSLNRYQATRGQTEGAGTTLIEYLETRQGGYRLGGRIEASYALEDGPGLTLALQGARGGRDARFLLHFEVPTGEHLRLMATYARMRLHESGGWFDLDDPNAIFIGQARLKVLPFFFLNGEISKMYRLRAVEDGQVSHYAPQEGEPATFQNVIKWMIESEIGFEF